MGALRDRMIEEESKKEKGANEANNNQNGRAFSESARDYETRIKETAGFTKAKESIATNRATPR